MISKDEIVFLFFFLNNLETICVQIHVKISLQRFCLRAREYLYIYYTYHTRSRD